MTRISLRPLARILRARGAGEDHNAIEVENTRIRQEADREVLRRRSELRMRLLGLCAVAAFATVGIRMWAIAAEPVTEPLSRASQTQVAAARAEIVDRNGRIMATNLVTQSLYAHPQEMTDPERAATELARLFPDQNAERLMRQFTGERKFVWVRQHVSPEQRQAVHDLGEPGLYFGPREMRLYPNGALASHILGGTKFGTEDVHFAEIVGTAGVERAFDTWLLDPENAGAPLRLSIDMTIQAAMEEILEGGKMVMNAKGAAAVLMHAQTGEIRAMVSLPDFDPNDRPAAPTEGDPSESPIFNRAVQGLYELGSTFKIFTIAQALELGQINPESVINTTRPLRWGRQSIDDFRDYGPTQSATNVIVKSSNTGTARIAMEIGAERQRAFLTGLGMLTPSPVELAEAPFIRPLLPDNWSELSTMTISYGHGVSISPIHLAAGYASLLNGGRVVQPTLIAGQTRAPGPRIVSEEVSAQAREMLRQVVDGNDHTSGTASMGGVEGYLIGGKTGTADKPRHTGGYYEDKVISTFASIFPTDRPEYVLIVMLDEPEIFAQGEDRRTAGWTAVPVSAEMTRRILPLLGLRPQTPITQ
ncbi:MAG: cell division protein FtsI (penicillin-binding protein 3) [Dinoroseobacter sp.]|jgi:cell division protein FtsI (penicillin-binding protein 3)